MECSQLCVTDDLLFGNSEAMRHLRQQLDSIVAAGLPVLIEGESGTGKEVLARSIHARSERRSRGFLKINCSAVTDLPSLDGFVSGDSWGLSAPEGAPSHRGAEQRKPGTIFFDHIGDLSLSLQAKLVALLQDSGMPESDASGVQVLCATKTPLLPKLESKSFREDLYYSINVVRISLPPLRDRRVDIPALASHFLKLYAETYHRYADPFTGSLIDVFAQADWPGNIRELENAVKRYIILGSADAIVADLQKSVKAGFSVPATDEFSLKALRRNAVRDCEYKAILTSLNRNHWNRRKTAQELQISYRSLLYIMTQLGFPKKRCLLSVGSAPTVPHYAS